MMRKLFTALALVAVCSGVGAAQNVKLPKEPSPLLFTVTKIDGDKVQLKVMEAIPKDLLDEILAKGTAKEKKAVKNSTHGLTSTSTYTAALKDLDISTAGGRKVTPEDFRRRVKVGDVVLVSADEHKVDPAYLKVFKEDTVVLVGVMVVVEAKKPNK